MWVWVNVNILHCLHGFVGFVLALVENIERHPMPKWLLFTPLTNKRKLWDIGVTKGDNTCSWKKVQVVHKREQNNRKKLYLLIRHTGWWIHLLVNIDYGGIKHVSWKIRIIYNPWFSSYFHKQEKIGQNILDHCGHHSNDHCWYLVSSIEVFRNS